MASLAMEEFRDELADSVARPLARSALRRISSSLKSARAASVRKCRVRRSRSCATSWAWEVARRTRKLATGPTCVASRCSSCATSVVDHGSEGYVFEGFLNVPITSNAAIRIVAFDEHDAGFIDNVPGTRPFKTSGAILNTIPQPVL